LYRRYDNGFISKFESFKIFLPKQPSLLLITKHGICICQGNIFNPNSHIRLNNYTVMIAHYTHKTHIKDMKKVLKIILIELS
jgi:hypothetical protein